MHAEGVPSIDDEQEGAHAAAAPPVTRRSAIVRQEGGSPAVHAEPSVDAPELGSADGVAHASMVCGVGDGAVHAEGVPSIDDEQEGAPAAAAPSMTRLSEIVRPEGSSSAVHAEPSTGARELGSANDVVHAAAVS